MKVIVNGYVSIVLTVPDYLFTTMVEYIQEIPFTKIFTNTKTDGNKTIQFNIPVMEYQRITTELQKSGITFEYK